VGQRFDDRLDHEGREPHVAYGELRPMALE
jgi:hypothetical protein